MSNYDVRDEQSNKIDKIVFHDREDKSYGDSFAYCLKDGSFCVVVEDIDCDKVLIKDKEHAENLIKALNKAIELEWLK